MRARILRSGDTQLLPPCRYVQRPRSRRGFLCGALEHALRRHNLRHAGEQQAVLPLDLLAALLDEPLPLGVDGKVPHADSLGRGVVEPGVHPGTRLGAVARFPVADLAQLLLVKAPLPPALLARDEPRRRRREAPHAQQKLQ